MRLFVIFIGQDCVAPLTIRCYPSPPLKRLKTIAVLLMLALWVPATSHALLESAGVIHQSGAESDSDGDHDHEAADGVVLLPSSVNAPTMSTTFVYVLPVIAFLLPESVEVALIDRIHSGTSPPLLPKSWQFIHRAALPVRAPSFAS